MTTASTFPELEMVLDQMSDFLHNWGFKRIHGKMWALLALSERPLDAADMMSALSISKALVSISIRELLDVKAVMDVGRSARGTRLYEANRDLKEIAYHVLRTREIPLLEQLHSTLQRVREATPETLHAQQLSQAKAEKLSTEIKSGSDSLSTLLSSLRTLSAQAPSRVSV